MRWKSFSTQGRFAAIIFFIVTRFLNFAHVFDLYVFCSWVLFAEVLKAVHFLFPFFLGVWLGGINGGYA